MAKESLLKRIPWIRIGLFVLIVACAFMFIRTMVNLFDSQDEYFSSTSSLISVKEISTLSVSEFVYNGIAQKTKGNGEIEYDVLYNSTVKVSVDAENIHFNIDEQRKVVTFTFSEFTYGEPIVDVDSIRFIPQDTEAKISSVITLCRNDAMEEAKKSEKLLLNAQDNLRSILEAWYSPLFEGYSFDYVFETSQGGDAK